jgi:hypothetical protein
MMLKELEYDSAPFLKTTQNTRVISSMPGDDDDAGDEDGDWSDIDDEDFEDLAEDKDDFHEMELENDIFDDEDDDHLPDDDF